MGFFVKSSVFCGFLKTLVFWVTRSEIRCSKASEVIKTANHPHPRLITNIDHEKSSKNRKITRNKSTSPPRPPSLRFLYFFFAVFGKPDIFECLLGVYDKGVCIGFRKIIKKKRKTISFTSRLLCRSRKTSATVESSNTR